MPLYTWNYGSIKQKLMKQFSTLESELTMILELLTDMVETRHLTQKQMMRIMENYINQSEEAQKALLPGKEIVNNIMNYSYSLEVLKKAGKQSISVITN